MVLYHSLSYWTHINQNTRIPHILFIWVFSPFFHVVAVNRRSLSCQALDPSARRHDPFFRGGMVSVWKTCWVHGWEGLISCLMMVNIWLQYMVNIRLINIWLIDGCIWLTYMVNILLRMADMLILIDHEKDARNGW